MDDLNLELKAQSQVPKVKDLCDSLGFKASSDRPHNSLTDSTHLWRRQYTTSDGTPGNQLLDWKSSKVQGDLRRMARDYLEVGGYGFRHWPPQSDLEYPEDQSEIIEQLMQLFWRQNVNEVRNAKRPNTSHDPPDSPFTEENSFIFKPKQTTIHKDSVSRLPPSRLAARPPPSQLTSFSAYPPPTKISSSRAPYFSLQPSSRHDQGSDQRKNKSRTITINDSPDLTSTSHVQPVASKSGKTAPKHIDLSRDSLPPENEEDLYEFHASDEDADKSKSRPRKKFKQPLKSYHKPSAQLPAPIAVMTGPMAASTKAQPAHKPSSRSPNDHFFPPKYRKPTSDHDSDDCVPSQHRKRKRSIHARSGSSAEKPRSAEKRVSFRVQGRDETPSPLRNTASRRGHLNHTDTSAKVPSPTTSHRAAQTPVAAVEIAASKQPDPGSPGLFLALNSFDDKSREGTSDLSSSEYSADRVSQPLAMMNSFYKPRKQVQYPHLRPDAVKQTKIPENSSSAHPAREDKPPQISASSRPTRKAHPSSTSLPVPPNQEPEAPSSMPFPEGSLRKSQTSSSTRAGQILEDTSSSSSVAKPQAAREEQPSIIPRNPAQRFQEKQHPSSSTETLQPTHEKQQLTSTAEPTKAYQADYRPTSTSLSAEPAVETRRSASAITPEEPAKQEKPSPSESFSPALPAQKTTSSPSPHSAYEQAKPPRLAAKPHVRYTIIKSRIPRLSKQRWHEGALVGKTVASLFDEIAELTRRPSIDRMNFKLTTSQSDSEYLIRRGEEDILEEMRNEFMQDMKADMINTGNTDFGIWLEPDPRDSNAGAGDGTDEINFDMW